MRELTAEQKRYIEITTLLLEALRLFVELSADNSHTAPMREVVLGYIGNALKWLKDEHLCQHQIGMVHDAVADVGSVLKMYNNLRQSEPVMVIHDSAVYEVNSNQLP